MPLRLNSITNDSRNSALLADLLGPKLQNGNEACASEDRKYFLARSEMVDSLSGEVIGRFVYTIFSNVKENRNEILDLDVTLDNRIPSKLRFLKMLPGSSDANEYYDVATEDTDQHFQIETVCRHTVPGDLVDTVREAYLSVFPFRLSMYDDIDEFNRSVGFEAPRRIGKTDMFTGGFSETFLSPGNFSPVKDGSDVCSFIIGTVEDVRDVRVNMGEMDLDFVLAGVRTGMGVVPVAIGREVFDIEGICPGKILAMHADVKADLADPDRFIHK